MTTLSLSNFGAVAGDFRCVKISIYFFLFFCSLLCFILGKKKRKIRKIRKVNNIERKGQSSPIYRKGDD